MKEEKQKPTDARTILWPCVLVVSCRHHHTHGHSLGQLLTGTGLLNYGAQQACGLNRDEAMWHFHQAIRSDPKLQSANVSVNRQNPGVSYLAYLMLITSIILPRIINSYLITPSISLCLFYFLGFTRLLSPRGDWWTKLGWTSCSTQETDGEYTYDGVDLSATVSADYLYLGVQFPPHDIIYTEWRCRKEWQEREHTGVRGKQIKCEWYAMLMLSL